MSIRATYRFARIPEWVLLHGDLSATDVRVFGVLDRFDGKDCIPSLASLGERLDLSERTLRNSLRALEAVGAVQTEQRFVEGRQTSNRYLLAGDVPLPTARQDSAPSGRQDSAGTGRQDLAANPEQEDLEQEDPTPPPPLMIIDGRFDLFWEQWPKKTDRKAAQRAFQKAMKIADHEDVLAGLQPWLAYWEARNEPEYIPYPATWLNKERWRDEPPAIDGKPKMSKGAQSLISVMRRSQEAR